MKVKLKLDNHVYVTEQYIYKYVIYICPICKHKTRKLRLHLLKHGVKI